MSPAAVAASGTAPGTAVRDDAAASVAGDKSPADVAKAKSAAPRTITASGLADVVALAVVVTDERRSRMATDRTAVA